MISRFWWFNFALSVIILVLVMNTIMIWQTDGIIPSPKVSESKTQWPEPLSVEIQKQKTEQYDAIATKNLYNEHRKENIPPPVIIKEAVPLPIVPVEKPDPIPEQIDILEKKDLTLYGVMIMKDYRVAFVNDVSGENEGKQIRVKQKDIIGDYTIERILPRTIIVSYQNKRYKVPLFEKKEENENPAGKMPVSKAWAPVTMKTPLIFSTKEDVNTTKALESKEKSADEESEWIILDTPFGEKRIRRKK